MNQSMPLSEPVESRRNSPPYPRHLIIESPYKASINCVKTDRWYKYHEREVAMCRISHY
jgi:hypothetical protein